MIYINKGENNTFCFSVKTDEGNALLESVPFNSKEELTKTINALSPLVKKASVFERKTDHDGRFLFTLKDGSGRSIGTSRYYSSEAGMENGIRNLRNRIAAISGSNPIKGNELL